MLKKKEPAIPEPFYKKYNREKAEREAAEAELKK